MANSPSHADAAADGTTEFAFKATFDVMKARQARRRSVFAYIMQRPGTAVYLLILVWVGGCACVSEVHYQSLEEARAVFIPTLYAAGLLFFQLLGTTSLVIFIEHLAMVHAFAVGVALLVDASPDLEFSDHDPALYTAFLFVTWLYMLYIFYVTLVITPFVQQRLAALGSAAWAIEPLAGQPGQFTYRRAVRWWEPWWVFRGGRDFWWFVRGRLFGGEGKSIKSFQYVGELDVQGRPHGRGRWTDTHPFGENLEGVWEHGEPTGPFLACETGSGFLFRSVAIGWCMHNGAGWKKQGCSRDAKGHCWGVCSVECSVSGQFFASLPRVELRKGPERFDPGAEDPEAGSHGGPATTLAAGAEWCLRHLSYRDGGGGDTSLTVTVTNNRMEVSGWECAEAGSQQDLRIILCPKPQSQSRSQSTCATASAPAAQQQLKVAGAEPDAAESAAEEAAAAESEATRCSLGEEPEIAALYGDAPNHLHVLSWTPAAKAGFEVVVLLHGWASPVQWAVQLFAMAGFPAHIKPIVYGWPSGKMGLGTATYMGGVNSANNAAVQRDFVVFVEGLLATGVTRLHIIAHSMGNRLLLGAIHSLRHVLTPEQSGAPSQAPVGGDGTHSGDTPAAAAAAAAAAATTTALRTLRLGSVILLHPEADLDRFVRSDFAALRRVCSTITLYSDLRDPALFLAEGLVFRSTILHTALLPKVAHEGWRVREYHGRTQWLTGGGNRCTAPNQYKGFRSLGLHPRCLVHPETSASLDMDVIDISWMEHNVADRHNFFTKNFWMVSDIREIIVSGRRARLRVQRLVPRGGNMFSFIAAPPQVS